MVQDYTESLIAHSKKLQEPSQNYATERMRFGQLQSDMMIVLSGRIKEYQKNKKNIGTEMALLTLAADSNQEGKEMYASMIKAEHNYKALGVLIESQQSAIMALQSVMRYNRSGEFAPEKE